MSRYRQAKELGKVVAHAVREGRLIRELGVGWVMQRQIGDLKAIGELEHGIEESHLCVVRRRGEGEPMLAMSVAEGDWLDWHARQEGTRLE